MNVNGWLEQVGYKKAHTDKDINSECWFSKFDDSYITHVGTEHSVKYLADLEITEELTHGVGFSPTDGKWYGWSHRELYGFKIGSTCEIGNIHYRGATLKELEDDAICFWEDEHHLKVRCEGIVEKDGERYFDIKWEYSENTPNKKIRGTISGCLHYIGSVGKGEWVAKTIEDAKQMAIDFNEGVS